MKVNDFVNKAITIATKYKTLYVMGCFGAPLNATNKKRYTTNHSYNKQASRVKMINNATADTFGFDCVCLIKAILWGWSGDTTKTYGGAKYCSNNVPDINANQIIGSTYCSNVSTDFSKIEKGELVWKQGHIGIYIGDGKVVESTPGWDNKVQITKLSQRKWTKHGKLKYIDYTVTKPTTTTKPTTSTTTKPTTSSKKTNEQIAKEVINGKWGNGATRKLKLTKAGYDYKTIQALVNKLLK